jgi:hypothetical protein
MAFFWYARWANTPVSPADVRDGFETPALSAIWDTSRFVPGAVTMQSEIVRAGRGAVEIVLRSRDRFEAGINGNADNERAELMEAPKLVSRENELYEYSFSLWIPANFPIVPTRLVIAQWKRVCAGNPACFDNSPVIAVRYVSGILRVTRKTGPRQDSLYETAETLLGK